MIVIRILARAEFAVYEKPLYPSVSDAAGITGKIDSFRKFVDASQTSLKNRKLIFAQLRCFVDGNNIEFLTLVSQCIPF